MDHKLCLGCQVNLQTSTEYKTQSTVVINKQAVAA